jgi:RNA ligase
VTTEKLDGSLGILYRLDNRIRWATRGSFNSTQSQLAQKLWDARFGASSVPENLTLLVEIIGPSCRNIVRYDQDELVLLGVRNRLSGEDFAYKQVQELGRELGLRVAAEVAGDLKSLRSRADTMDHTQEGFVSRWGELRLKVKSLDYLKLSRLIQGLTDRRIADLWYAGKLESLKELPEEFRMEAEVQVKELEKEVAGLEAELAGILSGIVGLERKAVVEKVGPKHPLFPVVMSRFSGKDGDVRRVVYMRRFEGPPRGI